MDRIEAETETHRTEKALKTIAPAARLPFGLGTVRIFTDQAIATSHVGQHLTVILAHLLARMKGTVSTVLIPEHFTRTPLTDGVPLVGNTLLDGLTDLVNSLSGPRSDYTVRLDQDGRDADVTVAIGVDTGDIRVGADGWRAFTGDQVERSRWGDKAPFGPYMAATMAAAQTLRALIRINWDEPWVAPEDIAFSLYDYTVGAGATPGPDLNHLRLADITLAGAGAGGTAALYTLASLPVLDGRLTIVEPGRHKLSNLGRYLTTTYQDVDSQAHKLETAQRFLSSHAPALHVEPVPRTWEIDPRPAGLVIASVDTLEGRWAIQHDVDGIILEAGVDGFLYTALRVADGGRCLECKTPRDPDYANIRRAKIWGLDVSEVKSRQIANPPITRNDLIRLANVQNRSADHYIELEGTAWNDAPPLVECGDTRLSAVVPDQVGTLPVATTAAGVVLGAEVAKHFTGLGHPLNNTLEHLIDRGPTSRSQRSRPPRPGCPNHRSGAR